MIEKLTTFDATNDLIDSDAIAAFMVDAFETRDVGYIVHALGVAVRAKGLVNVAAAAGISTEHLNKLLSETDDISLQAAMVLMRAVEVELTIKRSSQASSAKKIGAMRGEFEVPGDFDAPLPSDVLDTFHGGLG